MSAVDLIQLIALAVWMALGVITAARAVRRPSRASVDIALFFGALAVITGVNRLITAFALPNEAALTAVVRALAMLLPYLLLRLASDFGPVSAVIRRASAVGLALAVAVTLIFPALPAPAALFVVGYFLFFSVYSAAAFVRFGTNSHGVTRRRMRAVAWGSYLIGFAALASGTALVVPAIAEIARPVTQLLALASSISYAVGLAPPQGLRRYWQLPELRDLGRRLSELPRLSTTAAIVEELERLCGAACGARASVALWDEGRRVLAFRPTDGRGELSIPPGTDLAWHVFERQVPHYVPDAPTADPDRARSYRAAGVGPLLIAPITAGDRRLGVLAAYATKEPIFAEDDLDLVALLAQQSAVVLESRALIDHAAAVRAQEETARMKEDFVSAAAHDLRTPLTTIVGQAQLLERRAEREGRTADLPGIRRLVRETSRLARLVDDLLDASRIDRGAFPMQLAPCDLAEVARAVAGRERADSSRVEVGTDGAVVGTYDRDRLAQLIENLVDNALKYSPSEAAVEVRVWREDESARVAVTDHGIGIPEADRPHVFERFRRGSNVDHRRSPGIGLGLYICRGIVEQHGGRIWVESEPGKGSVFHVALPRSAASPEAPA